MPYSENETEPRSGIVRVPIAFVNAYLVDIDPEVPADGWVLVDTGIRALGAMAVQRAAAIRYGPESRPLAIVLTHGHFDHAGSVRALALRWRVPVFAHPLELPYLTGRSDYPPQDPTVGGALATMSRVFPRGALHLSEHVRALPGDGTVPNLVKWRVIHTPGHTPGHVSLWREADGVLLAGDALATMDQDRWSTTLSMPRELRWPPATFTTDWSAARHSVEKLAGLRPRMVAAGHGLPMWGDRLADMLEAFAERFTPPPSGRYVGQPARADERGVFEIPPPVPDPVGTRLRVCAGVAAAGVLAAAVRSRRGR